MAAEKEQVEHDYDYYDETFDDEEESSRGPIRMVVLLIVVAAFFGVGWIAFKQGMREGSSKIPILKAETGATKEAPTQPPGAASTFAEREIYERPGTNAPQAEQLLPPPEQPMEPMIAQTPGASAPQASIALPTPGESAPPQNPVITEPEEPVTAPPPAAATSAPETHTAVTSITPVEPTATVGMAAGTFLVQVAASRTPEEALSLWNKIQAKNSDLLGDYQSDVMMADLGAKGTFHRLRFGPFASRDDAGRVCDALKARKQDCIIVKK